MNIISTEQVKKAVYQLCLRANTQLPKSVYSKILKAYYEADENSEIKEILKCIIQNAKIAHDTQKPLCQDTGQVIVFVEVGQNVMLQGDLLENAINESVKESYIQNYFRKSVVANAVFDRSNTKTNTPAIIYSKFVEGDEVKISVLVKGGGSENKCRLEMLLPTLNEDEIVRKCTQMIVEAGKNACPPMFVGIGIGGTADSAAVASKKVFVGENSDENELRLAKKIKQAVNKIAPEPFKGAYLLDVKVKSLPTHIACMPVAVTINCHSDRTSTCILKNNEIIFTDEPVEYIEISEEKAGKREIFADDVQAVKTLKQGENVLLTGDIYVARDMAHKKLTEMLENGEELPFDLKDKMIFYAGPCPNKPDEVIGSVGPTTAFRMDKYAVLFYDKGLLATIAKGDRSKEVFDCIKRNGAKYFSVVGGIAALLAEKVKKSEIIAFEELGAEAVYKLYVEKLPVKVEIA